MLGPSARLGQCGLEATLTYDRIIYLLADTPECRAQIHRYIDVFEFPDGLIELRADGLALPYTQYDRLAAIDSAEVVDSKRLGRALEVAAVLQAQRDPRHRSNTPSHTHSGQAPHPKRRAPGLKVASQISAADMAAAIAQVCSPHSGRPLITPPTASPSPVETDALATT